MDWMVRATRDFKSQWFVACCCKADEIVARRMKLCEVFVLGKIVKATRPDLALLTMLFDESLRPTLQGAGFLA